MDVVGLQLEIDPRIPTNATQKHLVIERSPPSIRIDSFWKGRQARQGGESDTRGDVATGATLMRTFPVVMLEKRLGDGRVTSCSVAG